MWEAWIQGGRLHQDMEVCRFETSHDRSRRTSVTANETQPRSSERSGGEVMEVEPGVIMSRSLWSGVWTHIKLGVDPVCWITINRSHQQNVKRFLPGLLALSGGWESTQRKHLKRVPKEGPFLLGKAGQRAMVAWKAVKAPKPCILEKKSHKITHFFFLPKMMSHWVIRYNRYSTNTFTG